MRSSHSCSQSELFYFNFLHFTIKKLQTHTKVETLVTMLTIVIIVTKEGESCSVVSDFLRPHGLYSPWNSLGQNTLVGSHSLLQGIFPTQGSNPGLPHCRRILYQLSHQGRLGPWESLPKHWEILPGGGPAQGGLQDMGASSGPRGTHSLPRTATLNKGWFCSPGDILALSRDTFDCHVWDN